MTTEVPLEFRRAREFGRLDACTDQTPWKLSEWQRTILFPYVERRGSFFAPSVRTLTCEVNIHQNLTKSYRWPQTMHTRQFDSRHEVCPEDSERNQCPRPLSRRAARGIMQFEHVADRIVSWLKETDVESNVTGAEFENSKFIPSDLAGSLIEKSKNSF